MIRLDNSIDRFEARVIRHPGFDACWEWTVKPGPNGYGMFWPEGRAGGKVYAHRWAYEFYVGPIDEGLTIDHTCHTKDPHCIGGFTCLHRRCVRPRHLEAVTMVEQQRRRHGWHLDVNGVLCCGRGHVIEPHHRSRQDLCLACSREASRRSRAN